MAYANTKFKLNTGAEIPAIGFGTWQDKDSQEDAVCEALKAGYRHIDTARVYVGTNSWSCSSTLTFFTAMVQSRLVLQASRGAECLERTFSSPPSYGITLTTQTMSKQLVMLL